MIQLVNLITYSACSLDHLRPKNNRKLEFITLPHVLLGFLGDSLYHKGYWCLHSLEEFILLGMLLLTGMFSYCI